MAQNYPVPTSNPNMMMVITFFAVFAVNAVVIYLANMFAPQHVVLGTMSLGYLPALLLSTGVLAWVATLAMPFFTEAEMKMQKVLTPLHWMGGYLVINVVSVWAVTRAATELGLGVSSWMVVIVLAAVLDVVQGMVMMGIGQLMGPPKKE